MPGSVPFGMSNSQAASYAHKAMNMASAAGTGFMLALAEIIIQMLMEALLAHHRKKPIRDIERVLERLEEIEGWYAKAKLDLAADQDTGGQETGANMGLGQKLVNLPDKLEEGLGVQNKSAKEKAEWAKKAIDRYNEKHGIKEKHQGPKGPTLEM